MSTRTENMFGTMQKQIQKYIGKLTLEMLNSIIKKIQYYIPITFQATNIETTEGIVVKANTHDFTVTKDPKPLFIQISWWLHDKLIHKESKMVTLLEFINFINKFWTDKNWICTLSFGYYETSHRADKLNKETHVQYRNTKFAIPWHSSHESSRSYLITKVKPSIRTSRKPTTTKSISVDSLNGRKTSSSKSPFSKMVGVRPTKKCNFKKLI